MIIHSDDQLDQQINTNEPNPISILFYLLFPFVRGEAGQLSLFCTAICVTIIINNLMRSSTNLGSYVNFSFDLFNH